MQAHRLGLKHPKHLFIMYGSYETNWWAAKDDGLVLDCSPEDRAEVLEYSLTALHYAHLFEITPLNLARELYVTRMRDCFLTVYYGY